MTAQTLRTFTVLVFVAATAALASGCAYETRTASPQLSQDAAVNAYNTVLSGGSYFTSSAAATGTDPNGTTATASSGLLNQDQYASLYFVMDDSSRPYDSVLSMDDMVDIDPNYAGQPIEATPYIHVIVFLVDGEVAASDGSDGGSRELELTIQLVDSNGNTLTQQWISSSEVDVTNGVFSVTMQSSTGGGTITLQTNDTDADGNLNSAAKFSILGQDGYEGQISTMASYF